MSGSKVLGNILTSLRPAGSCVIDVMGKERLVRIFLRTNGEAYSLDSKRLIAVARRPR